MDQNSERGDGGRLVDLRHRLRTAEVQRLLALSVAGPDDSAVDEVASFFANAPDRVFAGFVSDGHVQGIIGGCFVHPGVLLIEVLAVREDARHQGTGRRMVDDLAGLTGALSIWADTDGDAQTFYERCGFTLRPTGSTADGVTRYRAERRHPPEPDGFFTSPEVSMPTARRAEIELPPAGNTLPTVPSELRRGHVPAFVLSWILEADEVGLMIQTLHPDRVPP